MSFSQELELLLRARYSVLYLPTREEERVESEIAALAQRQGNRAVYTWDFVDGYQGNPNDAGFGRRNPLQALELVEKLPSSAAAIFVLRDFHRFLDDVAIARKLRNLARILKSQPKNIIIIAPTITIPDDLGEVITVLEFPLPTLDEISAEVRSLLAATNSRLDNRAEDELIRSCQGLSIERIRRVIARSIATHGQFQADDIDLILQEKRQTIRQTQILDFYPASQRISDIGGLENLKDWLLKRGGAFSERARQYGLPHPRGLLLVGIQGTGKSLTAKAIAHHWHLPLLRLDVGRLFAGLVGESESRTRQMIQIAEALAPCVLWIDEIDKAFGNINSGADGDSGTSRRVFGSLITWMQEKTSPVFIVATANNVQILPAELLRKGRFDEIFFLNLPTEPERQEIFKVHLQRLRPSRLREFDLALLARQAKEFSGAEIEQVINDAMHRAFGQGSNGQRRDFTTEDIIMAIEETVPLAAIAREQIEALKHWAAVAGARTASKDVQLVEELKRYSQQRGITPLEVD